MNACIYILFYLLITEAQYGITTCLQVCIFACVTATLLWSTMPVRSVAFNDQHRFREGKIAKKFVSNNVLKFIGDTSLIKCLHHFALNTGWASCLECKVAYQRMFYRLLRMRCFPFADCSPPCCTSSFIVFPLYLYRLTTSALRNAKLTHETMNHTSICNSAVTSDVCHRHIGVKAALYAFLQRFAKSLFGLIPGTFSLEFIATCFRASTLSVGAIFPDKHIATDNTLLRKTYLCIAFSFLITTWMRTRLIIITWERGKWFSADNAYSLLHIGIISPIHCNINCTRAFGVYYGD